VHPAVYTVAPKRNAICTKFTAPQSDIVSAILSTDHIVELARLRDFLGK
jgi:hypothetical protein